MKVLTECRVARDEHIRRRGTVAVATFVADSAANKDNGLESERNPQASIDWISDELDDFARDAEEQLPTISDVAERSLDVVLGTRVRVAVDRCYVCKTVQDVRPEGTVNEVGPLDSAELDMQLLTMRSLRKRRRPAADDYDEEDELLVLKQPRIDIPPTWKCER